MILRLVKCSQEFTKEKFNCLLKNAQRELLVISFTNSKKKYNTGNELFNCKNNLSFTKAWFKAEEDRLGKLQTQLDVSENKNSVLKYAVDQLNNTLNKV